MKKLLSTVVLGLCLAALPAASHAQITYFSADLNGANEAPANASPAIGTALITTDTGLNTMRVQVTFTGLQAMSLRLISIRRPLSPEPEPLESPLLPLPSPYSLPV